MDESSSKGRSSHEFGLTVLNLPSPRPPTRAHSKLKYHSGYRSIVHLTVKVLPRSSAYEFLSCFMLLDGTEFPS